jgi:Predicted transcriptional regulators
MPSDHLNATFAALADPTRRAILARLALGEATVTELAKPFDMSGPGLSKHLKVLERAGLIARGREAQWRPCRLVARPAQGCLRLARAVSPVLGGELRSPGRLSARIAGAGGRGRQNTQARFAEKGEAECRQEVSP